MREVPCPACERRPAQARGRSPCLVGGKSIAEVCALPIGEARRFLADRRASRRASSRSPSGCSRRSTPGSASCSTSASTTSRSTGPPAPCPAARRSASGWPPRSAPASSACSTCSTSRRIGLHQRDNHRLIETLTRLRDLGNTLIVVEHDEDTIAHRRLGRRHRPGRGRARRPRRALRAGRGPARAPGLAHRRVPVRPARDPDARASRRATTTAPGHRRSAPASTTCSDVDVAFPLGDLVAVTGVSGSGKSTLVNDILYTVLANKLNGARRCRAGTRPVTGLDQLDKVVHVDQCPIGRTPRSNPATYTGVFDHVRKLFAETTEAKVRGYQPGRFSFNVKGGRCESVLRATARSRSR